MHLAQTRLEDLLENTYWRIFWGMTGLIYGGVKNFQKILKQRIKEKISDTENEYGVETANYKLL